MNNSGGLTVSGHLRELKRRFLCVAILFIALFILLFIKISAVFTPLLERGAAVGYSFISLSPQEVITQELRLAAVIALFVTLPFILYHAWAYITVPEGFKEKIRIIGGSALVSVLFLLGAIFAFQLMIPFMLEFLLGVSKGIKMVETTITVEKYVSFYISTITIFGTIMEMPAVTIVMSKAGIITPELLKKIRPFMIVGIFIISAIVTPPDVTSQLMVAVPMTAVYELCTVLSRLFLRKEGALYEERN